MPKNIEFDGKDSEFIHFCLYDGDVLLGCARGNMEKDILHVGRVAVNSKLRGKGNGRYLFEQIRIYAQNMNMHKIELDAIETAVGFYKKLGFITIGDYFVEAGWPHIKMEKSISV